MYIVTMLLLRGLKELSFYQFKLNICTISITNRLNRTTSSTSHLLTRTPVNGATLQYNVWALSLSLSLYTYIYICIQGVPGGMCQTSGECSLS